MCDLNERQSKYLQIILFIFLNQKKFKKNKKSIKNLVAIQKTYINSKYVNIES